MGYRTDYTIVSASSSAKEYLKSCSGYSYWDDTELKDTKWYYWKDHLKTTSHQYPDELIVLDGIGEEFPDIWRAYAKGGVVQVVEGKIVFEGPNI